MEVGDTLTMGCNLGEGFFMVKFTNLDKVLRLLLFSHLRFSLDLCIF
jgi:hypothetical protein